MLVNMGNLPLDEFYPAVSMVALMRIFRDQSLSQHHTMVVQAITFIFKSLGLKCVQFLPQVMPTFLNVIRVCDGAIREVSVPRTTPACSTLKTRIHFLGETVAGFGHCCAVCWCQAHCRSEVQLCFFPFCEQLLECPVQTISLLFIEMAASEHNPWKASAWFCVFTKLFLFRKTSVQLPNLSVICVNTLWQTVLLNNRSRVFKFLVQSFTLAHLWERKINLMQSANI